MSNGKFTPGPWKYTPSIPAEGFECFWVEHDSKFGKPIADVRGPQNDENTANARLISAAPELFYLLVEAHSELGEPEMWEFRNRIAAAIAKATGESHE